MKFNVPPAVSRYSDLKEKLSYMNPQREAGGALFAARKLLLCAVDFGIDIKFNAKAKNRNPGIYAKPIFSAPEVSAP
jgi:hypothetical protein